MSRFDQVIERRNTDSVKWDTRRVFGVEDALPMWVADMDFQAPEEVITALHKRAEHGVFGYTLPGKETQDAILGWLKKRHNWEVRSGHIITYSPGIVTAISLAIQAFTELDDKIVVQSPVYYPFFEIANRHKREVLYNQLVLTADTRYEIDFDDLEGKLAEKNTKLFILCNPHNPSGRVWSIDELTRMGQLCIKHDVLIIADEIHADLLLFDHKYTPMASINEEIAKQTITCIAPSKTFNLAGLKASALLIPNASLRRKYNEVQQLYGLTTINSFGADAMEAAYKYGESWLDELISYLEENFLLIENYLRKHVPELKVMRPESTYLLWIDARELGKTDDELKNLLLREGKIALEPGSKFGESGTGFLRMNFACPKKTLMEGLERFVRALSKR